MGYEFKFRLSAQDRERIANHPHKPSSIDELLLSTPGLLVEQSREGFLFTKPDDPPEKWPAQVSVDSDGVYVCLYDRAPKSADSELLNYLIYALLDICGRVELSEL